MENNSYIYYFPIAWIIYNEQVLCITSKQINCEVLWKKSKALYV
jgi:hypothetical protein